MAMKTYPNTPEEEAARINAESGDPNGITAEQVASNRAFNENLTNLLGFGETGQGFSLSTNPFAKLVAGVQESISADVLPKLPSEATAVEKASLNDTITRVSGGVGSGLNGATVGDDPRGEWDDNLGEYVNIDAGLQGAAGGVEWDDNLGEYTSIGSGGSMSTLSDTASLLSSKFPGIGQITSSLSKIAGGDLATGATELASGIAKTAGNLNDILSLKRASNLPGGAELFQQTGQTTQLVPASKSDWRVKISANFKMFDSKLFDELDATGGVVFPILPTINFSSSANYNSIDPVHNNYPFHAYKNSQVDDISINGQFPAETENDAAYWLAAVTFFRTATKMFYGQGENAGNPPLVCYLHGYGESMFSNVPVVIKNFMIDLPNDVNYIKCDTFGTSTWVPVLSNLSVQLAPIYNRRNLRQFDLKKFASGKMVGPNGVGYV